MTLLRAVRATDAGLAIDPADPNNAETVLSWRWVRDHGEDEASFDSSTRQRRVYAIGAEEPAPAMACELAVHDGVDVVAITWSETPEQTWISQQTLLSVLQPTAQVTHKLWSTPGGAAITKGDVAQVLSDDGALTAWLRDLKSVGYAMLGGYDGSQEQVRELASRVGYVRESIFGGVWELASDVAKHDDTAYTQTFLAPHTDGTYSHDAPGLQMFCCVERAGTGGESIVVDGFAIAETLRTEFPDDFAVLTEVEVPAHYVEPGVELRAARPAIRLDASGAVVQISMNNYDRSPMLLPPAEMDAFYRAYGRLHDLASDQSRWLSIRLEPGDVLITNNWRALHGRHAYDGARRFFGCYLNHEDFESRLRTLAV